MDFGDKLREIRRNEGLSQEQLAEKMGVSRQAITKWETGRGLPDVENMVILAEIFKMTLDELVSREKQSKQKIEGNYESESIYDIDCSKHFDIRMGSARKIQICSGTDEKLHVKLESEKLENLKSLFKIKLDEKREKLDVNCLREKGISRYEAEEMVDVTITLPENYTSRCEVEASAKVLLIENLKLERLEYDGAAEKVFVKDVQGRLELTSKSDYEVTLEGSCSQVDIKQWHAKSLVHVEDISFYQFINTGKKCNIYYQVDGKICEQQAGGDGENVISISGISSELIVDSYTQK